MQKKHSSILVVSDLHLWMLVLISKQHGLEDATVQSWVLASNVLSSAFCTTDLAKLARCC